MKDNLSSYMLVSMERQKSLL